MKNHPLHATPSGPRRFKPSVRTGVVLAIWLGWFCLGWATATAAAESDSDVLVVPLPALGHEAWQPLTFRSIEKGTQYEQMADPNGRPAYRASSECGASAMLLRLPKDYDQAKTPRLAWRWRIERGLENDDEASARGDDFAARVYVLFRFDPSRASVWRRLQNRMGERFFEAEIPGEALTYVWSSQRVPGAHWTSPTQKDARVLVLESDSNEDASRVWREAIVDLGVDPKRVFESPPRLQAYAIGLMTDADDTCREAVAWFSDFRLLGPLPSAAPEKSSPF